MSNSKPRIIAFCCANCASAAANVAQGMKKVLPENVKVVQVPCTGRIEILHLMKPFEDGADGVYVAGCQSDSCQYMDGISKASKRVAHVKKLFQEIDMEPERIEVFQLSASKGGRFVDVAYEMTERLESLTPIV